MITHNVDTLDNIIGHNAIKSSLKDFDFSKPLMFEGERGCGKTSLAYIMAKRFTDNEINIKDINCAYYTKIADMRGEIDNLYKLSLFGGNKVLILDEIHKLSPASMDAWLKPLETLPSNIFVIACTTIVGKMPNTLLRRFSRYKLKKVSDTAIMKLINNIGTENRIEFSKPMKSLLVEKCEGIPGLVITSIPKIANITDIDEAEAILDILAIQEDEETTKIFKYYLKDVTFNELKPILKNLLKKKSPDEIRIGLMNIIGGYLISKYGTEKFKATTLFESLNDAQGFPEKAKLINCLAKVFS